MEQRAEVTELPRFCVASHITFLWQSLPRCSMGRWCGKGRCLPALATQPPSLAISLPPQPLIPHLRLRK